MGKRRKHTVTRWIGDVVDDTKDLFDDILDRVKDVEEDARDAVRDVIDSGDDDDDDTTAVNGVDARKISGELAILSAALEELTAKVNILAQMQASAATASAPPPPPSSEAAVLAAGAAAKSAKG